MKKFSLAVLILLVFCARKPKESQNYKIIYLKGRTLYVELATTPEEWEKGLMGRDSLPDSCGMLFIFPYSDIRSFWMKNTTVPLSLAYIDSAFVIREIYDLTPLDETPVFSKERIQYVIEVNQGWFDKNGIKAGDTVIIPFLK
ncbi:MAG: DUF192 domain-containing protein [bacterium]|nr:DUF192 domain-containing protein [bacterium]